MANNLQAADLIGKVIIVGENIATIVIKSVQDNGMLSCEFKRGEAAPIPMPVTIQNLEAQVAKGTWRIADAAPAAKSATDEVEVAEVSDIVPKVASKREKSGAGSSSTEREQARRDSGKVVAKPKPTPKAVEPKPEVVSGKLTYSTYTSKKGKTCAKISGFGENDPAYVNAAELHGSASWDNKKGKKVLYLAFGHKYAAAAKLVCEALNDGKSFEDCKAIIDASTAERAQKREEKKAAVADKPAKKEGKAADKTYTLEEVAAKLRKLLPDGQASIEDIKKLLEAA